MKYFYDTEFIEGTQARKVLGINNGNTIPTIDLISIGIVSEDNREYYAVSKDFNFEEAWNRYDEKTIPTYGDMRNLYPEGKKVKEYWIRDNVLIPIFFELAMREFHEIHFKDEWYYNSELVTLEVFKKNESWTNNKKWLKKLLDKYGKSNELIKEEIINFLEPKIIHNDDHFIHRSQPVLYGYYSAYDHVVLCWLFGKMKDLPGFMPMYTIDLKQMLDELALDIGDRVCYESGNHISWTLDESISYLKKTGSYPKQENEHNALSDAKWNKSLFNFIQTEKSFYRLGRRVGKTTKSVDLAIQKLFREGAIHVPLKTKVNTFPFINIFKNDEVLDVDFKLGRAQEDFFMRIVKRLELEHKGTYIINNRTISLKNNL